MHMKYDHALAPFSWVLKFTILVNLVIITNTQFF